MQLIHPKTRHTAAAAAAVWMAIIFGLSSLSGSSIPQGPPSFGHFVLYAVLGALLYFALLADERAWRMLVAVALASVYGVTDEFHQSFVPGRTPDIADWAVDTAGAALAVIAIAAILRHRRNRTPKHSTAARDASPPPR